VLFTLVDNGRELIGAIDLATREQHVIIEGAHPFYDRSGHLLFVRGTTLMAAPFDTDRLAVTGAAIALLQGIRHPNIASAVDYSLSDTGTLVYVPAEAPLPAPRAVVWVDRSGRVVGRVVEDPVDGARDPQLSPDGRRLLLTAGPLDEGQLWVYDVGGSPPVPLITEGDNVLGTWSPDGARVAFMRGGASAGFYSTFTIAGDGGDRTPAPVPTGLTLAGPAAWSSAGDLILNRFIPSADIVTYRSGETAVRDLVATTDAEMFPALSPDERWLAYTSDRSGRLEIWAMRYPDGVAIPISSGGGAEPRWSRDATELFFRQGSSMMAVSVAAAGERPFGAVTKLFEEPYLAAEGPNTRTYDVAADGRFLMLEPTAAPQSAATAIVVVQNFSEEIERLMAAR
jgi:Tol biopolymer transport system component